MANYRPRCLATSRHHSESRPESSSLFHLPPAGIVADAPRSERPRTRTHCPPLSLFSIANASAVRGRWWHRPGPAAPPCPTSDVPASCRMERPVGCQPVLPFQTVISMLLSIRSSWPFCLLPHSRRSHCALSPTSGCAPSLPSGASLLSMTAPSCGPAGGPHYGAPAVQSNHMRPHYWLAHGGDLSPQLARNHW